MFDIEKAFKRRDSHPIAWGPHRDGDGWIYGIVLSDNRHLSISVGRSGLYSELVDHNRDLVNVPDYEWSLLWLDSAHYLRSDSWFTNKTEATISANTSVGGCLVRRPKGSIDTTEYELLPLDTEIE